MTTIARGTCIDCKTAQRNTTFRRWSLRKIFYQTKSGIATRFKQTRSFSIAIIRISYCMNSLLLSLHDDCQADLVVQIRNFRRQGAMSDFVNELLRNGKLSLVIAIWNRNVHLRTHTCSKGRDSNCFGAQQIDGNTNRLVNSKDRADTICLHGNLLAIDNFAPADDCWENYIDFGTGIHNNGLELCSCDFDGDILAIVDVHLLLWIRDLDLQHAARGRRFDCFLVVILNDPLGSTFLVF